MKLFRSKSIGVQRKALELALTRVKKIYGEIRELSARDWKGGELEIQREVSKARDALESAVGNLKLAEESLKRLERMAVARGK